MKKNGFTLVELLGVVTILAMLGLVIVPVITNVLNDKKRELYNVQIKNIEESASNYVADHIFEIDIPTGTSKGITLGRLKNSGYLDDDIVNPITKVKFDDSIIVMVTNGSNGFSFKVCVSGVSCGVVSEL